MDRITDRSGHHVVFGAGQIGTPLARMLQDRGHAVRLVRRSGGGPDGVEVRHGDARQPGFAAEMAHGAAVLYHCMNPAYDTNVWSHDLPQLMASLISAAKLARARLVVLDNLYMLGRPGSRPMNEDTPMAPASRKGEIRARVAAMLMHAQRSGELLAVSGRASDFYGPGGVNTYFGALLWKDLLAGKPVQVLTDPDIPHSWHYTLDVAHGLATLGEAPDDAYGHWWMLPAAPPATLRAMIARFAASAGVAGRVVRIPRLVQAGLSPFMPLLRELGEMRYQFEAPFVVEDVRFRQRFGATPAPPVEAANATVAWAREAFGPR